jgi:hypothetical protein
VYLGSGQVGSCDLGALAGRQPCQRTFRRLHDGPRVLLQLLGRTVMVGPVHRLASLPGGRREQRHGARQCRLPFVASGY